MLQLISRLHACARTRHWELCNICVQCAVSDCTTYAVTDIDVCGATVSCWHNVGVLIIE